MDESEEEPMSSALPQILEAHTDDHFIGPLVAAPEQDQSPTVDVESQPSNAEAVQPPEEISDELPTREYVCCGQQFCTRREMDHHKDSHREQCSVCLAIVSLGALQNCTRAPLRDPSVCRQCGTKFHNALQAQKCYRLHKNPCAICQKYVRNMDLTKHRREAHKQPPLALPKGHVPETSQP